MKNFSLAHPKNFEVLKKLQYGGWGGTWAVVLVIFLLLIIAGYWFNGNRGFGQYCGRCCNCQCGGC